jgi:hypothetical protein
LKKNWRAQNQKAENIFLRDSALQSQVGGGSAIRTSAKLFSGKGIFRFVSDFLFSELAKRKRGLGKMNYCQLSRGGGLLMKTFMIRIIHLGDFF